MEQRTDVFQKIPTFLVGQDTDPAHRLEEGHYLFSIDDLEMLETSFLQLLES